MLFDLRSRRRRNTVRIVYVLLAVIMIAGLLLVGVGTGSGGGILNAVGGNGSGGNANNGNAQRLKQLDTDLKAADRTPTAGNWTSVISDRLAVAEGLERNGKLTAKGRAQLQQATADWQHLISAAAGKPSYLASKLVADVYKALGNWNGATSAWEYAVQATGEKEAAPLQCLALTAYAAGNTSQGQLAAGKTLKLAKSQKMNLSALSSLETELTGAKKTKTTARSYASQDC